MGLFSSITDYINTGRAGQAVSQSQIAAEHGVLGAVTNGQGRVDNALQGATVDLNNAKDTSIGAVQDATHAGNTTLQGALDKILGNTSQYQAAGAQGVQGLQDYAASKPTFQFNPNDYYNSDAYKFQLQQGQDAIQNTAAAGGMGQSGAALKELTKFGQGLASTYYNDAFNRSKQTFDTNQNATLQNLGALINTGEFGTGQANGATAAIGGQQAANTVAAGNYAGNTGLSVADLLARLQTQGQQFNANLGFQGSKAAGDYAVGAGEARAGSILGQGSALNGIVGGVAGLASPLIGSIPLGGGKATTLAGLLGGV